MPIQPVEYILANNLDYISGNIVKYASRWDKKGEPYSDLCKIIEYAKIQIRNLPARGENNIED
tara:strand:+ start:252 stop:440 length:189 start_codon:yes stop_codon:yes gene_type:complete